MNALLDTLLNETLWARHPRRTPRNRPSRLCLESPNRKFFKEVFIKSGNDWKASGYLAEPPMVLGFGRYKPSLPIHYRSLELVSDSLYWESEEDLDSMVAHLVDSRADLIRWSYYRPHSEQALRRLKEALGSRGFALKCSSSESGYETKFNRSDVDEKLPSQKRSKRTRERARKSFRDFESQCGAVRFQLIEEDGLEDLFEAIRAIAPHSWQWKTRGTGMVDNAFHRSLCEQEVEKGRFRSYVLVAGDTPLSYLFGTTAGKSYFCEKTAYDDRYEAFRPGGLLWGHVMDDLFTEGFETVDFGIGAQEYKRNLLGSPFETYSMIAYRATAKGRLNRLIDGFSDVALHGLRTVRNGMKRK